MPSAAGQDASDAACPPEEQLRAEAYRLLARFLGGPPDQSLLSAGAALTGDDSVLGRAIAGLARQCARVSAADTADEYQRIFIGLGRGELVPYGSYYLTGFLQEKPLARLRQDMARLGIGREPSVGDPEDHVASVLEMMAGLIDGAFGAPASLEAQQQFFAKHLGSWGHIFFRDLEAVAGSPLYAAVGAVGRVFLDIEEKAFAMA